MPAIECLVVEKRSPEDAEEKQQRGKENWGYKSGVTANGQVPPIFTAMDHQPMNGFHMRMFFLLPFLCVLRVLR